jgi:two-component system, cell cycle sensor histidine kinase PleC
MINDYLKFIAKALICVMLVLSIIFIVRFRVKLLEDLRTVTIEGNALGLSNYYLNNVLHNNDSILNTIGDKNTTELAIDENFMRFTNDSLNIIKDISVVKLNIYDLKKRVLVTNNQIKIDNIYSSRSIYENLSFLKLTNMRLASWLFDAFGDSVLFSGALNGKITSQVMPNIVFGLDDSMKFGTLVQVLVPIKIADKVTLIMELYYDISVEWEEIEKLQNIAFFGCLLVFFLFITILMVVSSQLETMITKQHEVNTELIAAKEKAEKESIEKSKFLANISHELRTPLNAIIGFSEIIKDETLGVIANQQYKDYANDINNSGNHLLSLINDILDYSKAAAEKLTVDSIELDVSKILSTSLRLVAPRAEEAKIHLVEDVSKESLILIADPKRLKQAVLNLLSNSVKFTPEGGTVTLSAAIDHQTNTLNITVRDTGIGIADKDISKAMSTFGQVDNTLSRKYEGTGLGLPLTKKLVELMKGTFSIKSELGFGTSITLSFPCPVVNS